MYGRIIKYPLNKSFFCLGQGEQGKLPGSKQPSLMLFLLKVSREMTRGLRAFLKAYPMTKAYLIYGGERRLREDNIEIIPIKEALLSLPVMLS